MSRSFSALLALLVLGLPTSAAGQTPSLVGTVGPDFTISLTRPDGMPVSQLDPGTYTILVRDQGDLHNFHLLGPGVDQGTGIEFVGEVTWTATLVEGRYRFFCDPHADLMSGNVTVGNPPPPPPPPPPSPPPVVRRLVGSVGPSFTISLKTPAGARVTRLTAGTYTIAVRDRSAMHNFHLLGPGANRKTTVAFRGTATWRVRLRKGAVYRFRCDPHASVMKGRFRVA